MKSSRKKIVMIVEDDKEILHTTRDFLESEGYEVWEAENGFIALEHMKTGGTPDLILLDMKMPVMNGWEFAIEFTNRYDGLTPIVVMTAAADAEQRSKEISAIGWVGKPFNLDDLLRKIKKHERK